MYNSYCWKWAFVRRFRIHAEQLLKLPRPSVRNNQRTAEWIFMKYYIGEFHYSLLKLSKSG
jgi:hypothetical protein